MTCDGKTMSINASEIETKLGPLTGEFSFLKNASGENVARWWLALRPDTFRALVELK